MLYNSNDLKNALREDIIYINKEYKFNISNVVFDSREITNNSLFIAQKGKNTDGHNFIQTVLENNDTVTILAEYLPNNLKQVPNVILVKNTTQAFEHLAIFSRNRIKGHIIGITGSVGKTSTKDAIYHCLSIFGKSFCNQQSFNNYNGVLTSLSNTPEDTEFAIYEMGMNTYNEMDKIRDLIKPEISIILNIKLAHIGNFNSEEEIAIEKSKIIHNNTKTAILNLDDKWFNLFKTKAENCNVKNILTFGTNNNADIILKNYKVVNNIAKVEYQIDNKIYNYDIYNIDYNIIYNTLSILAIAKYLNLSILKTLENISTIETTRGRNNIEYTDYQYNNNNINLTIVNGSYNAVSPDTFITGLNLMNKIFEQGKNNRKVCIWGDMSEIGEKSKEFHLSLKEHIINSNIDLLITVGENMKLLSDSLKKNKIKLIHFENVDILCKEIKKFLNDKDLVFIKSSKNIKTYKVLNSIAKNKMKIFV